jgi:hypothetical protein
LWNLDANQEIESAGLARQLESMLAEAFRQSAEYRRPGEVVHGWSAHWGRLLGRLIFALSARAVAWLQRRRRSRQ